MVTLACGFVCSLIPSDIWYAGFKPRAKHSEADLDALTRKRYPTAADYAAESTSAWTETLALLDRVTSGSGRSS